LRFGCGRKTHRHSRNRQTKTGSRDALNERSSFQTFSAIACLKHISLPPINEFDSLKKSHEQHFLTKREMKQGQKNILPTKKPQVQIENIGSQ
jgi:hypothetical protein